MKKQSKPRPSWQAWAVGLLTLASTVSAGFVGAFFLLQPLTPPTLAATDAITTMPVVLEDSTDEHSVRITVTRATNIDLLNQGSGIVTSLSCAAGSVITSGTSVYRIDGHPVVLLALASPLWRDITLGDSGEDVTTVKAELSRLGFETSTGEMFHWQDLTSIRSLFTQAGGTAHQEYVAMADFIWMPAPELTIADCPVQVGQRVEPDSPILSIDGGATATYTEEPTGLISGTRVLRIDDVEIALAEDLNIPADSVSALIGTPSYAEQKANAAETAPVELAGTISLVQAVPVASLPPSAITVSSGADGCVRTDSARYSVRIVTSELGQTIVQFIGEDIPEHIALQAPPSCP